MNSLYFWRNWNSPYKQLYFLLLTVFIVSIAFLGYASFVGFENIIRWEVETELEPVKVVVDQFAKNLFNFTIETNSYYALDKFVVTEVQVNTFYSNLYLGLVVFAMLFILTTISYLELYWFMGAMMGFLFFLFSLNLEMIQLFGRLDRLPMVIIFLGYGTLCFVFNSFYKASSYLIRLISFFILTIAVGIVIYKFSSVANPFLYMANFGSLFPVVVTVLFVVLIAHDIIKGFLHLVSGPKSYGSKNGLLNFVFASILYLVNVFLLLMKKLYIFDLNIVYLNPFFLLVISSVIGIWMFKKRTEMFSGVLPFTPAGAFVYLSLAIISLSGASYAFINGNSGIIEVYERIIVYGHLFFGAVFFVYVLINFVFLFDKKISIFEIVYKPVRLTFLIVPTVGIAVSTFFFLYQKKYPYHLAMAGYYSYAGDVMAYEADYPIAFQYYQKAVSYDFPNHRANYSIAALSSSLNNKQTAKGYYENALYRAPTVQSYIGLSNAYSETGELFKALFQLQEGLKVFPEDGRLYNNLAVMFHKTKITDSSIHYFLKAKQVLKEKEVPFSNVLYLMAKNNLFEDADSLMQSEKYPTHFSFINNKLAISNQLGKKADISFDPSFVKDSIVNANMYAYLINSNINALKDTSAQIINIIKSKVNVEGNASFHENLRTQLSLKEYYTGNKLKAIIELMELDNNASSTNFEFATLLGNWMLVQEQYTQAADYFQKASKSGNLSTQLNYTLASALAGKNEDALFVLEQLVKSPDKEINKAAEKLITVLSVKNNASALELPEPERLQYYLFKLNSDGPASLNSIYTSFTNDQAKIFAGVSLSKYYLSKGDLTNADAIFLNVKSIPQPNLIAEGERNYLELLLKSETNNGAFLRQFASEFRLNPERESARLFFVGKSNAIVGDSIKAIAHYKKVLKALPFMDIALNNAIEYLSVHGNQEYAYNSLIEILSINNSISMQKTYLNLCMDMGLVSYAGLTLEELKGKISASEYMKLEKRYMLILNQ